MKCLLGPGLLPITGRNIARHFTGTGARSLRRGQHWRSCINVSVFWMTCAIVALARLPVHASAQPVGQRITPTSALSSDNPITWIHHRTHSINKLSIGWLNTGSMEPYSGSDACSNRNSSRLTFPASLPQVYGNLQIWIGGVRQGDTLVSTTRDLAGYGERFSESLEFWPLSPPENVFLERTIRPSLQIGGSCIELGASIDAVSEHDLISVATDTLTDARIVAPNSYDGRLHKPLGIKMTSRVMGWSYSYAEDFVLLHCTLENIGYRGATTSAHDQRVSGVYIGLLEWDHIHSYDVRLDLWSRGGGGDDLAARQVTTPLPSRPHIVDNLNTMWRCDNDGDPAAGQFDNYSVPSAIGVRVLSPLVSEKQFSFNWWHYWPAGAGPSWGPVRAGSKVEFESPELGHPHSDRAKYQMMTNGEDDYPSWETALPHQHDGWLAPPSNAAALAAGAVSWELLSFGPYDLALGDTLDFAIAIVGGEHLHSDPEHFSRVFDAARPDNFVRGLNKADLIQNAFWAGWMYDTPGLDTDGDGYVGEFAELGGDTIYYRGDGVPDFSGPPPPPAPHLTPTSARSLVILRWNGRTSESFIDPFLNRRDFEGYRVYMSRTGHEDDWAVVTQRDLVNFDRLTWNENRNRWQIEDPPFSRDSLKVLYDDLSLLHYGYPFEPDSFSEGTLDEAFMEIQLDPIDPANLDTVFRYFRPHDVNDSIDDVGLAKADSAGLSIRGTIRRVYPLADTSDVIRREDGSEFRPAYEYELAVEGLHVAEPVYFAATAFDHGDPATGLEPLESARAQSTVEVWPIVSSETVKSQRPKPGVYPNPYRLIDDYYGSNWENRRGLEPDRERARQVTFYNVPDTCTVSIWSLDGDLVRRIKHSSEPGGSEATVVRWDLITRNTQSVKSGIYIWSVESRLGTDVGKLVIIK